MGQLHSYLHQAAFWGYLLLGHLVIRADNVQVEFWAYPHGVGVDQFLGHVGARGLPPFRVLIWSNRGFLVSSWSSSAVTPSRMNALGVWRFLPPAALWKSFRQKRPSSSCLIAMSQIVSVVVRGITSLV